MCRLCQRVIAWVGWKFGVCFCTLKKKTEKKSCTLNMKKKTKEKNEKKYISDKVSFNCICSMFYFGNVNNEICFHSIMGKVKEVGEFAMFEYYTCSHI